MLSGYLKRVLSLIISAVIVINITVTVSADPPDSDQISEGLYIVRSMLNPNKVLSVNGNQPSNESEVPLTIWDFSGKPNQIFYFSHDKKDNSYEIIPLNSCKCLGVENYNSGIEAQVKQNYFSFRTYNKWEIQSAGAETVRFKLKSNGLSLKVQNGLNENGARLNLGFQNETPAQKFKLQKVIFKNPDDFKSINNLICDRKKQLLYERVELSDKDQKIPKHSLDLFENMRSLKIPTSVTAIEDGAFDECEKLEEVECDPKWLCKFDKSKLRKIIIPPEIKELPKECFKGCKNLRQIEFSSGIKAIGEGAFENCENLAEIVIPFNAKFNVIGQVTKIVPTEAVNKIPARAFKNCKKLTKISLPPTVSEIDKTAFEGCLNLDSSNVNCPKQFEKLFSKFFTVESLDGKINPQDLQRYISAQGLDIPIDVEIDDPGFLKLCKNLRIIQCEPYFLNYLDKSLLKAVFIQHGVQGIPQGTFDGCSNLELVEIPNTVEDLQNDIFEQCRKITTAICPARLLKYFDKKNLKNIVINDNIGIDEVNKLCFPGCKNLESISIPSLINEEGQLSFKECPKLMSIDCGPGKRNRLVQHLKIDDRAKKVTLEEYGEFKNTATLEVPTSVDFIEEGVFSGCESLSAVKADPKLLKYLPKGKIETVCVPKGVKNISPKDFDGCINLTNVIFEDENARLFGQSCKDFENISKISCFPDVLQTLSDSLKNKLQNIEILEGCRSVQKNTFRNFFALSSVKFPNTLEKIGQGSFFGCKNLSQILIPNSVKIVEPDSFINCENLRHVVCKADLLKNLPKKQIRVVEISDATQAISSDVLDGFENLEKLILPKTITELPKDIFKNCKQPSKISCCPELLKNLKQQNQPEFPEVEISKDDENLKINDSAPKKFEKADVIQPVQKKQPPKSKEQERKEEIDRLVSADKANAKYADAIRILLEDLDSGANRSSGPSGSIGDLSRKLTAIYQKIKENYNMVPYPVQCLTVLRLADEILHSKGSISEVKTGEGKTFIISALAILLAQYGKKLDVITSTTELAKRDQQEQKKYYDLFGITSGVLYNKQGDKDFFDTQLVEKETDASKHFNVEVFNCQVVYSTNANLEFVYLHSLFKKNPLRNRPYDVAIVDEVDNMLMDQSSSPSILAEPYPIMYLKDVLKIVYIMQNYSDNDILDVLKGYFPKVGNFDLEMIRKMKRAAQTANKYTLGKEYIIKDGQVVIMDQFTGHKRIGSRWNNYIHEMVEIKENVSVRSAQVAYAAISQHMFFNQYDHISGLTGTMGTEQDIAFLKLAYGVNIFKVPKHILNQKLIISKPRSGDINCVYEMLFRDIMCEAKKGRPVLVIMDSVNRAEGFLNFVATNLKQRLTCGIIAGINPNHDKMAIESAGIAGRITIATQAAGRGTDIKLDSAALAAGGLHVIIPFPMLNQRVLEQAIGRSGRQGQPGSATVYTPCIYSNSTPRIKSGYKNLMTLQGKFSKYIQSHWSWIYDYNEKFAIPVRYPFGISIEEMLDLAAKSISESHTLDSHAISNYFKDMIMTAWGMFFNDIQENIDDYEDFSKCEREYNNFLKKLHVWVSANSRTLSDQKLHFIAEQLKRVDWADVAVRGALIVGGGVAVAVFPLSASAIAVAGCVLAGAALEGVSEVYNQLRRGEEVNWGVVLTRTLGGGIKGGLLCIPGIGPVSLGVRTASVGTLENFVCNAMEGNCSSEALVNSAIGGAVEGLSAGVLKFVGNKIAGKALTESSKLARINNEARRNTIQQLSEAELEQVFGGSKTSLNHGLIKRYIQDIEAKTNIKLTRAQIDQLKNALRNKSYSRLDSTSVCLRRREFNKIKDRCILEWEKNTGQKWPTYSEPLYAKNGLPIKKVGDRYDAHHIIENKYGGDHAWWNITPARFPNEHQGGIHATNGPASRLFK